MKPKTLVELLTLSTNLYMISRDEKLMESLSEMTKKGKQKINDVMDEFSGMSGEDENMLIQNFLYKAKEVKDDIAIKMEEVVVKVYENLRIAHTDEVKSLNDKIDLVKRELALAEARIINLEQKIASSATK